MIYFILVDGRIEGYTKNDAEAFEYMYDIEDIMMDDAIQNLDKRYYSTEVRSESIRDKEILAEIEVSFQNKNSIMCQEQRVGLIQIIPMNNKITRSIEAFDIASRTLRTS